MQTILTVEKLSAPSFIRDTDVRERILNMARNVKTHYARLAIIPS